MRCFLLGRLAARGHGHGVLGEPTCHLPALLMASSRNSFLRLDTTICGEFSPSCSRSPDAGGDREKLEEHAAEPKQAIGRVARLSYF